MKDMKEWYSAKELAGMRSMPRTKSGVIRKAKAEQWQSRCITVAGGKRREYHLSALPEETRIALLTSITPHDGDIISDYIEHKKLKLSPEELKDPKLLAKISCARAFEACPAYAGREKLLEELARQYGKSKIQIRRWIQDVELLRTRTFHRITVGAEQIEIPEARAFVSEVLAYGIAEYARDMKAGRKAAYNKMREFAASQDKPCGDYSTFTRVLKKIPSSIWLRIRQGATGFELNGLPKIIREWTAVPVQSVICGDQKIFDYVVYDPETDDLVLPEGYFWMDCSSRMIIGAWIELGHYNQFTVSQSLREALRYGIPDEIYTDWGKPEGAKHITQLRQRLSGFANTDDFVAMYDKYGNLIEHRKAQPGKPWVKPIENIMNIIEQKLIAKNLPGYRKRETKDAWINKEQQQILKKQAKQGALMTVEDFIQTVFDVIDEHNRTEKRLKEGKTIVPIEFFVQGLIANPRTILHEETLDYICLPKFIRKPYQARIRVTIRGEERGYYAPALSARKQPVAISVDPYDREKPAILTEPESGEFIGLAEAWNVQNPFDTEGLTKKRQRQAELMRWVNEQARRIKQVFDLFQAPEIKAPVKITSATHVAKKANEEHKVYVLRKEAQRQELIEQKREADELQKALIKEFEAQKNRDLVIDPWQLGEGRDRYLYWYQLKLKVGRNEHLTDTEAAFYERYQKTLDYKVCNDLHERYGNLYIGGVSQ